VTPVSVSVEAVWANRPPARASETVSMRATSNSVGIAYTARENQLGRQHRRSNLAFR
jgi:hypothetical protein